MAYPSAVEYNGNLYVGYSNNGNTGDSKTDDRNGNANSSELAVIPIKSLAVEVADKAVNKMTGAFGVVTNADNEHFLRGYACLKGVDKSILLHLYVGGPAGSGQFLGYTRANQPSEAAIGNICGTASAPHRFEYKIPAEKVDQYAGQRIFVHGIMPSGLIGRNDLLAAPSNNAGRSVALPPNELIAASNEVKIPSQFNIIWHLGIQTESLADAAGNAQKAEIDRINKMTSGYYFLIVKGGAKGSYWPSRPDECLAALDRNSWNSTDITLHINGQDKPYMLNSACPTPPADYKTNRRSPAALAYDARPEVVRCRKNGTETLNAICAAGYKNYITGLLGNPNASSSDIDAKGDEIYSAALARLIQNVGVTNDTYKEIIAESGFSSKEYSWANNKLSVKEPLPVSFVQLQKNGVHPTMAMIYQEPSVFVQQDKTRPFGTFLNEIPGWGIEPDPAKPGQYKCLATSNKLCLNSSLSDSMLGYVKGAFARYAVGHTDFKADTLKLATDMRAWRDDQNNEFNTGTKYKNLNAVVFETNRNSVSLGLVKGYAEGTASILMNHPTKDIYFLMSITLRLLKTPTVNRQKSMLMGTLRTLSIISSS